MNHDAMLTERSTALTKGSCELERFAVPDLDRRIEVREDPIALVQLWQVLRNRRWLVLVCLASVMLLVVTLSLLTPKRYDASARIMLELQNSDALGLQQMVTPMSLDMNTRLETQMRVLESNTIAAEVIRQLGLHHRQEFAGKFTEAAARDFDDVALPRRADIFKLFHKSLTVQLVPKTQIIEIRFRSQSPKLAAEVANAAAATFIEHNFQTKYRATVQTSSWLTQQLDDLKKRAESSQDALISYQKNTGILGTDETHNIITAKLDELNKQLSVAEGERIVKEARYRIAMTGSPELIANIVPESVLGALYKRRAETRAQYAQVSTKYGPAYPRVLQLGSQLNELDAAIAEQMQKLVGQSRAEYDAALASEQMLATSFQKQKQEAYKLNENAMQYAILRRDVESSRDLYEGLLKKLKEAGILASLKSSNINIVDPASVPVDPAVPNLPVNLALGLMGGLLVGVAAAFVVENSDASIRTPEDVESRCGLPSLGIIPRIRRHNDDIYKPKQLGSAEGRALPLTMARPNSGGAEAFRALRTSVLLSSPAAPPQVIVVTSALAGDGKSFTALNLAVVLAQARQKVLLLDADFRRPTIHKLLGLPLAAGLTACLAGRQDPAVAVEEIKQLPGLHVVPAGYTPPYPSEMLASEAMRRLLQRWRQEFNYIVLDTPPVLAVTDAVVCASLVDAVILVARAEKTGRQSLLRARDLLYRVRANITGVVVNDLALNSAGYHAYYGHDGSQHNSYYHHEEESC